jgi:non-ribosomal peptide synthase protein (TIGR01720 family)
VRIDIENHGRDDTVEGVDLSRTVGWFTSISPLAVELPSTLDPVERLAEVKSRLRAVPRHALADAMRHTAAGAAQPLPFADVLFNYLGRLDRVMQPDSALLPAAEDVGPTRSPRNLRPYLIEIDAAVVGGELRLRWVYSRNRHADATVARVAARSIAALRRLLAGRIPGDSLTPEDFPLAGLHRRELRALVGRHGVFDDAYRLSPLQEAMLLYERGASAAGASAEQFTCEFAGVLDLAAFRAAWDEVVRRHPILRTVFVWDVSAPVQLVLPAAPLEITTLEWSDDADPDERWRQLVSEDRTRGMRLDHAPLMRLTLARIGDRAWRCLWTYHHIVLDGWSLSLVLREVMLLYDAYTAGRQPALVPARPYSDYIRWLARQNSGDAERFWRAALAGFSERTPIGGRVASRASSEYRDEVRRVDPALEQALRQVCGRKQVTLNTLFQGAWALLLAGRSGRDDVVFGATVSGRPADLPAVESIVGLFINVLPVRTRVPADASVTAWLQALQMEQSRAKQFEHSPLVQEWSAVPLGQPLFESLVVFENYPAAAGAGERRDVVVRDVRSLVRTRYPLTLVVLPGDLLQLYLSYDAGRFSTSEAAAILDDVERLLARLAAEPDCRLAELTTLVTTISSDASLAASSPPPYVAPRTPIEHVVAAVWDDLLGGATSVTRSLFDSGGHSLLATRLAARIGAAVGVNLPLQWMFETPTIAGLARRIEVELIAPGARWQPIDASPHDTRPSPLSFAQEPLWAAQRLLPRLAVLNFSAMFRVQGPLNVRALDASFAAIVERHHALRTAFSDADGAPVQQAREATFHMPLIDLTELAEPDRLDRAASLIAADAVRPFDLTQPPLIRSTCIRLEPDEHLLSVTIHHIATDGWSSGVLARELMVSYDAYRQDRSPNLPVVAIQYADFARWEREQAATGAFEADLRAWVEENADPGVEALALPTDFPRQQPTLMVAREDFEFAGELLGELRALSARESVSLFMTLLTGFELMLVAASQQRNFWVGTLMANRGRPELEHLIGLFVNTVLLRCTCEPGATFRTLLQRTRDSVLRGFARQHVPFALLVDRLERERHIDRADACRVLFVMQNAGDELALPALAVTALHNRPSSQPGFYPTSFDLVANVIEEPDRLIVSVSYKSELFHRERVRRYVESWREMLQAMQVDVTAPARVQGS